MSKTDDIVKRELSSIGDHPPLYRRVFLGSSNYDQKTWSQNGLTFGINGVEYGSNDFAWYKNENWKDPLNNTVCNKRPVVVIEASHCLNTKSYGNAQLQRFHHAYGSLLSGILSIYYLKKGPLLIRHDLLAAALAASNTVGNRFTRYIVTDELSNVSDIVNTIADKGENSEELAYLLNQIELKMEAGFNNFFARNFNSDWKSYLESRAIFHTPSGWVKILGPRYKNFTDSSVRMGHIVVGEGLVSKYLLLKSKLLSPDEPFYFVFPFIERSEINKLNIVLRHDKEWQIITHEKGINILSIDELTGLDSDFSELLRTKFKNLDLNKNRHERDVAVDAIIKGLLNGSLKIKT